MAQQEREPSAEPFKFDVFISYSRRDLPFARRLHRALDNYTPPRELRVPQRRLRVFRDESDFRGNEYAAALDSALASSAKLLVICSPRSRDSDYVGAEIANFASRRGKEHIVSVLAAGRPNNETGGDDGDKAFHEQLVERLPIPLAADYRGWDEKRDRVDRDRFESAWFKLLADLYVDHGIERSELEEREKQRQRRTRRLRGAVIGAVMASLAALTIWALISRNEAITQTKTARSRSLALQSMSGTRSFDVAMLLAVAAYQTSPTFEAWEALFVGLQRQPTLDRFLYGVNDTVEQVALAPSGACAVAATRDHRTIVWDVQSGAKRLEVAGRALPDRSCTALVVALPDGRLERRSLQEGQSMLWSATPGHGGLTAWAADATGTWLAVAYAGGRLQVRSIEDGHVRAERDDGSARWRYLRFSPDGEALIAIDRDAVTHRWDVAQLAGPARTARCTEPGPDVFAISPDLRWCAAGGPGTFGVRDLTREDAETIDLGSPWILALDFSPDGRSLMAGVQFGDLQFWSIDAVVKEGLRAKPTIWTEHRTDITAAAYATDGKAFISAGRDGTVVVWNAAAPLRLISETRFGPEQTAVANDANTGRVAVGTSAGDVLVSRDGSASSLEKVANVGDEVTAIAVGSLGDVVAGTKAGRLFAITAGAPLRTISTEPRKTVARIRLSVDRTRAAVMFADGSVKIWNPATGQLDADVAGPGRGHAAVGEAGTGADIAFSSDSSRIAFVRGGNEAFVWDTPSARLSPLPIKSKLVFTSVAAAAGDGPLALGTGMYEQQIVLFDPAHGDGTPVRLASRTQAIAVTALAFSPDSRVLLSGNFDGTVSTWDVAGRRLFGNTHQSRGAVVDLSYATNGFAAAAVTPDGRVLRWNLNPAEWIAKACAIANRDLTAEERVRFLDDAKAARTCPGK